MLALLGSVSGCGGGAGTATPMAGSTQTRGLTAGSNGTAYPLYIYLPPGSEASRATMPVVYLLDGESRFQALVDIVEAAKMRVAIVGIGNEAQRSRDYVPPNACTTGGGGQVAFLDFICLQLIPFIETTFGADPLRRILLGHSHGGSFVLYALFNEVAADRHFSAYLASDASIGCMNDTVYGWESAYAAANTALAVRLHVAYAYAGNVANGPFAAQVQARQYTGLVLAAPAYGGSHVGMIPQAFADAMVFALA